MILPSASFSTGMQGMLRLINLRAVVLLVVLGLRVTSPAVGQAASSSGNGQGSAGTSSADHPVVVVHDRSVKLSWGASTPSSKSPRDVVVGYNVYRSQTAHDPKPKQINSKLCTGTTYTDTEVKPGNVYFYVTRGVTANGVESHPSNEVRAEMPPQ
jgi:hypothetical protein